MYIKTFEGTRKLILEKSHINLFVEYGLSNLFGSIMVDPAFYVLDKSASSSDSTFISLDQYTRTPQEKFKKDYCLQALSDIVEGQANRHVYFLQQSKLKEIKSWPFIYWISDEFREKFTKYSLGDYCPVTIGFITGKNECVLRHWWEENDSKWQTYTKGGPYNKWYGNNWLVINTEDNFKDVRRFKSGHIPSVLYKKGVTYTGSGSKGVTFRILEDYMLYDKGANSLFPDAPELYLAILNSSVIKYASECLNPTVNKQPNDINRLPFVDVIPERTKSILCELSSQNIEIKKSLCQYSIIEPLFKKSPIQTAKDVNISIFYYYDYENRLLTNILLNESIIDKETFSLYDITSHDRQMVLDKEGIPVGDLSVSHAAKQAYLAWLTSEENEFKPTKELLEHITCCLKVNDDQPKIDDFNTLYQNNNGWEEFCIKHKMNPIEVWWQFKNAKVLPPQRTQVLAFELITDVMRTVLNDDDDGIIPLGTRIGEDQMSHRIEQELQRRGYSNSQISQIVVLLGSKDLDTYLRDHFFQQLSDHLNLFMYLPKTPFIWHITSGSLHALDVMVSIYKWNRNTLSRIKSVYAARRETQLNDAISQYADSDDASTKMAVSIIREMKKELEGFVAKIDDLLASGYDPKLNDGVGKNIAPLQKRGMLSYDVLNAGQLKKYLNADW
jgi:hypothetical protein